MAPAPKELDWRNIETAPLDQNLVLAVIESGETHVLGFACRRTMQGWINAMTGALVEVHPTHWQAWTVRS